MDPRRRRLIRALTLAATAAALPRAGAAEAPLVAAASDLQFVLPEIAAAFEAETNDSVRLTFGSSGNFARQIRQGAPFELFLSADEAYVLDLAGRGLTRDAGVLYAIGRLAELAPSGGPLVPDGRLEALARALEAGQVTRFAIANPEHAPYGQGAAEALRHAGLWEAIQPALVLGENVSQAAQFALSGNAQGGIVAYSLALAPRLAGRAEWALIPADWHRPLRQRMVLTEGAGRVARAFYDFLRGEAARELLDSYGFTLPGGAG